MPSIKGILKTLKEFKFRPPKLVFCPKCKSPNIFPNESYGILPSTFSCKDCDYEGMIVLEIEKIDDEKCDRNDL